MTKIHRQFSDRATYDSNTKTAISIRDGVLEYLGSELGMEPADKIFTVYRSPATIANAAHKMTGIVLTDEHVSLDFPPPDTGSTVTDALVIDALDESTATRLAVMNHLNLSDTALQMLGEKRQLSLGYSADLIPHQSWDFEQIQIIPHHLAAVPAGRCGQLCSFLDRKLESPNMKINKVFLDAGGAVSLEQIVEIATALPDAIKSVPVDKLQKLMPALQEILSYAKGTGMEVEPEMPMESEDMEPEEMAATDMDPEKEDETVSFSDAAVKKIASNFADAEVKRFAQVITKARDFLDAGYSFVDKTANQIMRDALATQSADKFEDSELAIAFKLLKKSTADYSQFGDSAPSAFAKLANQEL